MLGWHFIVKIPPNTKQSQVVAMWDGGFDSDRWLLEGTKDNKSEIISNNGGYPNIYVAATEILPPEVEKPIELLNTEWCIVEVWDQS